MTDKEDTLTQTLPLTPQQMVWRCRRGVRELDVILSKFLETSYDDLVLSEKVAFQELLTVQDPTIIDWLFNKIPVDNLKLKPIIEKLQSASGV